MRHRGRQLAHATVSIVLFAVLLRVAAPLHSAPQAELWPDWLAHDPSSQQSIPHDDWDHFLQRYLIVDHPSGINLVRYAAVTRDDRAMLERYLQRLQATSVSTLNRDEQIAFWINLYNAYTVKIILDHYPVDSIRDIDISGPIRSGPWDASLMRIEGRDLSLNDIEHRILRPIWQDSRIHFALNCASLGCPDLQSEAFRADSYQRLLERGAEQFLTHERAVDFDREILMLSSIFDWYGEDFGQDQAAILAAIARYTAPDITGRLRGFSGRIRYHYDWALNEP